MIENLISTWSNNVLYAISASLETFLNYLPNLIGALIIFTLGWIIAGLVKKVVIKILNMIPLEPFIDKVGISRALQKAGTAVTPIELFSDIIRWSVVLVFLNPTVEILGLSEATDVLNAILLYIPNVIIAVIILMFGLIFADLTANFVRGAAATLDTGTSNTLSTLTRYAIYVFVILAALSQLKIAQQLIVIFFTGFVAMLAIAGGLAFGLGGKEIASELLSSLRRNLKEKTHS